MKRVLVSLSLSILGAVLFAACASQKPVRDTTTTTPTPSPAQPPTARKFQGKVLRIPTAGMPLVSFRVAFQAGSIDDPPFRDGLTALTADLMGQGGTKDLTSAQLLEALFPMAGEIDVRTDKELTVFSGTVHKDHAADFVKLFAAAITQPRFDEKEFQRLREDAVQDIEKRLRSGDDENLGKAALDTLVYAGHPYGSYTGGSVQGLRAATLADVKAQYAKVFTQDRMIIGVGGAVDDALVTQLQSALGTLPSRSGELRALPAPSAQGPKYLLVQKDAASTAVSMGYPWDAKRGDPDFYALMVAGSILGEHRQMVGRLMRELREKRGLNYGDYAYIEHFSQEGWGTYPRTNVDRRQQDFTVWLRPVVHENAVFALRAALYELDRFAKDGVTEDEFQTAKGFLSGYTLLFEQTPMRRVGYAIDDVFYGTQEHLASFRKALGTMTRDDVNRAIHKHLDPSKLRVAVVTNDAEGLKKALLANAPSTITYPAEKPDPAILAEDKNFTSRPFNLQPTDIQVVPVTELFEK